jgi:hypothetical protein
MKNLILICLVLLTGASFASAAIDAPTPTFVVDSVADNYDVVPTFTVTNTAVTTVSTEPLSYEVITSDYGPTVSSYDIIFNDLNCNKPVEGYDPDDEFSYNESRHPVIHDHEKNKWCYGVSHLVGYDQTE